jgi:opacity protein-like surface antigen
MKVDYVFLFLVLFLPVSLDAQSKMQFGIRAGLNTVNNVQVPKETGSREEYGYRLGYHIGILTKIQLAEKLLLSPELIFNNKGSQFSGDNTSSRSGDGKVHYNYLTLPILLEYRPFSKLSFQFGPEFGYLLSAKTKFGSETLDLFDWWKSLGVDYNRFEFGLGFGTEYLFTEEFSLGIRYFHGYSSVLDTKRLLVNQGNPNPDAKYQNRTFQLSLSYIIW